jgi:hypothetical protein
LGRGGLNVTPQAKSPFATSAVIPCLLSPPWSMRNEEKNQASPTAPQRLRASSYCVCANCWSRRHRRGRRLATGKISRRAIAQSIWRHPDVIHSGQAERGRWGNGYSAWEWARNTPTTSILLWPGPGITCLSEILMFGRLFPARNNMPGTGITCLGENFNVWQVISG